MDLGKIDNNQIEKILWEGDGKILVQVKGCNAPFTIDKTTKEAYFTLETPPLTFFTYTPPTSPLNKRIENSLLIFGSRLEYSKEAEAFYIHADSQIQNLLSSNTIMLFYEAYIAGMKDKGDNNND